MKAVVPILLIVCCVFIPDAVAIQCYSGSQFSIIECPSLNCIKQTLGLDTVRYCDGTGTSSICATYRVIEDCQNIPNLGEICCCTDQLCNSSGSLQMNPLLLAATVIMACGLYCASGWTPRHFFALR